MWRIKLSQKKASAQIPNHLAILTAGAAQLT